MTPFDTWYAAHIEPALKGAPPAAVKMAKASAAEIWNAALQAVNDAGMSVEAEFPGPITEHELERMHLFIQQLQRTFAAACDKVRVAP